MSFGTKQFQAALKTELNEYKQYSKQTVPQVIYSKPQS